MTFFTGLFSPIAALAFVTRHKGVKRYMFLPILLALILFVILMFVWDGLSASWLASMPQEGWFYGTLHWILGALSWLIFGLFFAYTFSMVGMIFTSPFNDLLCQKVLKDRGIEFVEPPFMVSATRALKDVLVLTFIKIAIMLVLMFTLPFLLIFHFAFFIAFDFFDYAWSYRAVGFKKKMTCLKQDIAPFFGFAVVYAFLLSIPFINILFVPLAVVSASMMAKMDYPKLLDK